MDKRDRDLLTKHEIASALCPWCSDPGLILFEMDEVLYGQCPDGHRCAWQGPVLEEADVTETTKAKG